MNAVSYTTAGIEELYDRYADMLFRIAYAELLKREDAEDAVQEVFIKYLRRPVSFREREHEKAWFIRVTVNVCHDMYRKRKERDYTPIDQVTHIPDAGEDGIGIISNVLSMPEKFKTVILLYYFEDMSVEERGESLGLSKSAVKMRLARGREYLKNDLGERAEK